MDKGIVFDIQRYSIHDGPGIRTTVFLKGCPLKCLWCSNPESQSQNPEIMFERSRCTGCGRCVEVCPHSANLKEDGGTKLLRSSCHACGECVSACPNGARQLAGKEKGIEEILREIERDAVFYKNSGGGVTLSGGEPMSQPEFVGALLKRCKERGLHTVLDSCGHTPLENWDLVVNYVDLILFDLKQMEPATHRTYTGVSNELILASARSLASRGIPLVIRVPFIPGYTDLADNVEATALFVKEIGTNRVELLPFHRLCISKYQKLDKEWKLDGIPSPAREDLAKVQQCFISYGLTCSF
jgi:pyruvate formate lyase activating enzyme